MRAGTSRAPARVLFAATLLAPAALVTTALAAAPAPSTAPATDSPRLAADTQHPATTAPAARQPFPTPNSSHTPSTPSAARTPTPPGAPPTSRPVNFNEAYGILTARNIFSRSRTFTPPGGSFSSRPVEVPLTPQQQWVLTGVTRDENTGAYTAFLENIRTGETTRHHTGQPLAGGKISRITLNSVDYLPDGAQAPLHVDVGSNLEGHAPAFASGGAGSSSSSSGSGSTYTGSTTSSTTPGGPPPAPGSTNDILERLRQRRLQETHQ